MKYARRTFAIVSTISISHPAPMSPMEAIVNPPSQGSRLDAYHPQNGGLIPCRFTVGGRRPHREVPIEAAFSASADGAGRPRRHRTGDHAGTAGSDLAAPAG